MTDLRRPLRVGMVCPYSFDVPGGVQNHVLGLARYLRQAGHRPYVLAPGELRSSTAVNDLEDFASVGGAVPVPYNGSVARVNFGPLAAARVRRWLRNGRFDLLHIHEPVTPSISLLALWAAEEPVVATFHTATPRSRSMQMAGGVLRAAIEKIDAGIAVSESARNVVVQHLGRDAVVIPNGIRFVDFARQRRSMRVEPFDELRTAPVDELRTAPFDELRTAPFDELRTAPVGELRTAPVGELRTAPVGELRAAPFDELRTAPFDELRTAPAEARSSTEAGHVAAAPPRLRRRPRLIFIGRLDEPRKGLDVLLAAVPLINQARPDLEVIVAGQGNRALPSWCRNFGTITEEAKIALLHSADVFVAPQLARESFGIVLLEAMASGVQLVASDLPSFVDLLGAPHDEDRRGDVFAVGDHRALARAVLQVLERPDPLRAARAQQVAKSYDWSSVGMAVLAVYRAALSTAPSVRAADSDL